MKLLKSLSALLLLTLSANTVFAGELPYSDTSSGSHFEAIYWTREWGIFSGYSDGRFKPDNEINRAELAKVLVLGSGVEETDVDACAEEATRTFSDVPADEWYTDYIYCAESKGWVSGDDGADTYRPGDPILKAEAFKMLVQSQYGTPDDSYQGSVWYDVYSNFLNEHQIIMEEESYSGSFFTYSFIGLGNYEDNIGFDGNMSSKMARFDIAELLYRLRTVFLENDAEPFNLLQTFDETAALYGTEFEVEGNTLSIADSYFGFRLENLPLDKVGDVEDLRVYIENPSGFENGSETVWYVAYPYEEDSDVYYGSGTSGDYTVFFGVSISDGDNHDFWPSYDDFENDTGIYTLNCEIHSTSSVAELLAQVCVVDEAQNIDAEYTNFSTY